jgi:hypothetical protein
MLTATTGTRYRSSGWKRDLRQTLCSSAVEREWPRGVVVQPFRLAEHPPPVSMDEGSQTRGVPTTNIGCQ